MFKLSLSRNSHKVALLGCWLVFLLASPIAAQVGSSLCACSPASYTFDIDLDGECKLSNTTSPGIEDTICEIVGFPDAVVDFRPTQIIGIDIIELDQERNPISLVSFEPDMLPVQYKSITHSDFDPNPSLLDLIGGIQFRITGANALGEVVINIVYVQFTNECGVSPVISPGYRNGWIKVVDTEPPQDFYCPAPPTSNPTTSPTMAPLRGIASTKSTKGSKKRPKSKTIKTGKTHKENSSAPSAKSSKTGKSNGASKKVKKSKRPKTTDGGI